MLKKCLVQGETAMSCFLNNQTGKSCQTNLSKFTKIIYYIHCLKRTQALQGKSCWFKCLMFEHFLLLLLLHGSLVIRNSNNLSLWKNLNVFLNLALQESCLSPLKLNFHVMFFCWQGLMFFVLVWADVLGLRFNFFVHLYSVIMYTVTLIICLFSPTSSAEKLW